MPYHVALDGARRVRLAGDGLIGTTKRGIGPAYGDRALAHWHPHGRPARPRRCCASADRGVLPERNAVLEETYGLPPFEFEARLQRRARHGASSCAPHIVDTTHLVQDALRARRARAARGRPGHAARSRPRHVSRMSRRSNPIAGGACTGGGVGPLQIDQVIGVLKAYSTRVGSGPFPTELYRRESAHICSRRAASSEPRPGRRRRCGWFDFVPLRYAVAVNSVSSIMLNKLDILSGLPRSSSAPATGRRRSPSRWPLSLAELERAEPVYETFAGWMQEMQDVPLVDDLPAAAAALRRRARGACRRPDHARQRRAGADADDRPHRSRGVAARAGPQQRPGPDDGPPSPRRGRRRPEHALCWKLAQDARACRRSGRDRWRRPAIRS